jgi:hypothetical protein
MREMYSDDIPMAGFQAILEGARGFGLSEDEAWRALDDVLLAVGTEATLSEYLDELPGALARRIVSTARHAASNERRATPEQEPQVPSEEIR